MLKIYYGSAVMFNWRSVRTYRYQRALLHLDNNCFYTPTLVQHSQSFIFNLYVWRTYTSIIQLLLWYYLRLSS